jgi:hypothetical protein
MTPRQTPAEPAPPYRPTREAAVRVDTAAVLTHPWCRLGVSQVPFSSLTLPAALIAQWRSPPHVDPLLSLPVRNEYIPKVREEKPSRFDLASPAAQRGSVG